MEWMHYIPEENEIIWNLRDLAVIQYNLLSEAIGEDPKELRKICEMLDGIIRIDPAFTD